MKSVLGCDREGVITVIVTTVTCGEFSAVIVGTRLEMVILTP